MTKIIHVLYDYISCQGRMLDERKHGFVRVPQSPSSKMLHITMIHNAKKMKLTNTSIVLYEICSVENSKKTYILSYDITFMSYLLSTNICHRKDAQEKSHMLEYDFVPR